MLMDPALQAVLQECGTPQGLRRHLANPETKRKIEKLASAGLVKLEL